MTATRRGRRLRAQATAAAVCACALASMPAHADPTPPAADVRHEDAGRAGQPSHWLVFLDGIAAHRDPDLTGPNAPQDFRADADVLYTRTFGAVRVLAETLLSTEDSEIERLQVGWEFATDTLAWLGRVHQPSSAWNTAHHHGQFLQTAITRPSIEQWEDEGGTIPQHVAGALFETVRGVGEGHGLQVEAAFGAGPSVGTTALEPVPVLGERDRAHKASLSGRLSWLPDVTSATALGLLGAHHELPVEAEAVATLHSANHLDLQVLGAFVDWQASRWRVIATAYHVVVTYAQGSAAPDDRVWAGYVQGELAVSDAFTAFARHENSSNAQDSAYFRRAGGDFAVRRSGGGLRWNATRHQALTFEAMRTTTFAGPTTELRLQWSGVVP